MYSESKDLFNDLTVILTDNETGKQIGQITESGKMFIGIPFVTNKPVVKFNFLSLAKYYVASCYYKKAQTYIKPDAKQIQLAI